MTTTSDLARRSDLAQRFLAKICAHQGPPVSIMEVCGTHTVAIARMGLRRLLPPNVTLLSGPGCPVCVTPVQVFDEALCLVREEGVTLATYGDALRVPGSDGTLSEARAAGADVRVVYSASDALHLALTEPKRQVVFLGLGFETTAPSVAWTVRAARDKGVTNFSVLSAHKALMPALAALLADPEVAIGAFLCPGHATMVLGANVYRSVAEEFHIPCVVAGFEPNDVLAGIAMVLDQIASGTARVENAYPRAVGAEGNGPALAVLGEVFQRVDSNWRGLGNLPVSGYDLAGGYSAQNARLRFLQGRGFPGEEPTGCRCADVLRGLLRPPECPLFGTGCTPHAPVGACMVSSEGSCGAYLRYQEVA